jgi:hypothetical protein
LGLVISGTRTKGGNKERLQDLIVGEFSSIFMKLSFALADENTYSLVIFGGILELTIKRQPPGPCSGGNSRVETFPNLPTPQRAVVRCSALVKP